MQTEFQTISNTEKILGISRTGVYRLIESGQLNAVKIGRRRMICHKSITTFADQLRNPQATTIEADNEEGM